MERSEAVELTPIDPRFSAGVEFREAAGADNVEIVFWAPCAGLHRVTHRIVTPTPQLLAAIEGWMASRERPPTRSDRLQ